MLQLNENQALPMYEQLYEQLKERIISGKYEARPKLTSVRRLAKELNISRNTVEQAYQQLCAEGYIMSRPCSGYYANHLERDYLLNQPSQLLAPASQQTALKPLTYPYDFRFSISDAQSFPFDLWQRLQNKAWRSYCQQSLRYNNPEGELGLRQAIADYLAAYRGVRCSPEQIILVAGIQYGLSLICQLLGKKLFTVAVEEPCYNGAKAVFGNYNLSIKPIDVRPDGIDISQLKASGSELVYVTPSHQFPTGAVMPVGKRLELLEWARRCDAYIVEDDYNCHFRYNLRPIPSLQSLDSTFSSVIYIGTFSKSFLPSLRLSYMVIPPSLLLQFREAFGQYASTVSYIHQKTLELFMTLGYWERHLRKTSQVYKKKHDLLLHSLAPFQKKLTIYGQQAGLHLLLKPNSHLSEPKLIQRAAEFGIGLAPVSSHWYNRQNYSNDMVIMKYSGIPYKDIPQAVSLLAKAWF